MVGGAKCRLVSGGRSRGMIGLVSGFGWERFVCGIGTCPRLVGGTGMGLVGRLVGWTGMGLVGRFVGGTGMGLVGRFVGGTGMGLVGRAVGRGCIGFWRWEVVGLLGRECLRDDRDGCGGRIRLRGVGRGNGLLRFRVRRGGVVRLGPTLGHIGLHLSLVPVFVCRNHSQGQLECF
jgi:hypothetical protein